MIDSKSIKVGNSVPAVCWIWAIEPKTNSGFQNILSWKCFFCVLKSRETALCWIYFWKCPFEIKCEMCTGFWSDVGNSQKDEIHHPIGITLKRIPLFMCQTHMQMFPTCGLWAGVRSLSSCLCCCRWTRLCVGACSSWTCWAIDFSFSGYNWASRERN